MTKRRQQMRAKKQQLRQRKLEKEGRLVAGVEIPADSIPADRSQQATAGYSSRYFYQDQEFTCIDCGAVEVWSAEDQQWYFERVKAHPASQAVRCSNCRQKIREQKEVQRQQMRAKKKT